MNPTQNDLLTAKVECLALANNPAEIPSPFERLPGELVLTIFEYVPEAIRELRLACRALQLRVDEFVRQPGAPRRMHIALIVPIQKVALFELRWKYRRALLKHAPGRIGRWTNEKCEDGGCANGYVFTHLLKGSSVDEWASLVESMGKRVTRVQITKTDVDDEFGIQCKLLDELHFQELTLFFGTIAESSKNRLIETIKRHNIVSLSLMGNVLDLTEVDFLLELSSLLQSLHIRRCSTGPSGWAPLIVEMLSRRLDKLHIGDKCLTREGADHLIEHLPFIGKQLWFKASFLGDTVGRSDKVNSHVIHESSPKRPNKPNWDPVISIIHKSRLKEVSTLCD